MKMKVWHIPQIPGKAFEVDVETIEEGVKIMDVLGNYDLFQYNNNIKPDYCNVNGINIFDPNDDYDSPNGSWISWYDEETDEDDPYEYLISKKDEKKYMYIVIVNDRHVDLETYLFDNKETSFSFAREIAVKSCRFKEDYTEKYSKQNERLAITFSCEGDNVITERIEVNKNI